MRGYFVVAVIGIGALAGGRAYWKANEPVAYEPSPHFAAINDNSTSQVTNCTVWPNQMSAAMKKMTIGPESKYFVVTLGSQAKSSFEPILQIPPTPIPLAGASNFSGDEDLRSVLKAHCETFGTVPLSSILRAVRVAIDQLKELGCGRPETGTCRVWLKSDLEDTVSRMQIEAPNKGSLSNELIDVHICGYAAVQGGGGPRGEQVEQLKRIWLSQFTQPARVAFAPFCVAGEEGE